MSAIVHGSGGYSLTAAEIPYANGRVGAVRDREGAGVGRLELSGRRARSVTFIPENRTCSGELVCNVKLRRGRGARAGRLRGRVWLGRFDDEEKV